MAKLSSLRACLVAEQFRPEPNNKTTILGFLGVTPNVTMFAPIFPMAMAISFMVLCDAPVEGGDALIEIEMDGPDNFRLERTNMPETFRLTAGQPVALMVNIPILLIPSAGEYIFKLYSDGELHSKHPFSVLTPP